MANHAVSRSVIFLPGITTGAVMDSTSVTSKGQVTIPKNLRQKLGLRQGSKVAFTLMGDRLEMRVVSTPMQVDHSGFGLLKSRRAAVPADFDPATLVGKHRPVRAK